jgi:hypothetical protein
VVPVVSATHAAALESKLDDFTKARPSLFQRPHIQEGLLLEGGEIQCIAEKIDQELIRDRWVINELARQFRLAVTEETYHEIANAEP